MRPYGRISTHMSFRSEICPVFLWNDFLALMLNSNAVGGGHKASSRPMSHREAARAPLPRSSLKYTKVPAVGIAGKCCQCGSVASSSVANYQLGRDKRGAKV